MGIQAQIDRIKNNVTRSLAKVAEKGVTVPADANSDDLEGLIDAITGGAGGGSGSALPTGISAIECGSVTPTSDISATHSIAHNLGVIPDFLIVVAKSIPEDSLMHALTIKKDYEQSGQQFEARHIRSYYNGSTVGAGNKNYPAGRLPFTETTANIECSSSASLKAGVTYYWIVGVIDGLN